MFLLKDLLKKRGLEIKMVTVSEMKKSVHRNCKIFYKSGLIKEGYVEEFQFERDEDEEPFLLYTPNMAVFQSEIERIEFKTCTE